MAAVCEMDESQLIAELLKTLSDDVKTLKTRVEKLPTEAPTDYRTSIEGFTQAVQDLKVGRNRPRQRLT